MSVWIYIGVGLYLLLKPKKGEEEPGKGGGESDEPSDPNLLISASSLSMGTNLSMEQQNSSLFQRWYVEKQKDGKSLIWGSAT